MALIDNGNADLVKAISNNVRSIISETIKWQTAEDGISPNADLQDPLAIIDVQGEAFEYTHGERPKYSDVNVLIQVLFTERTPDEIKDKSQEYIHRIRDNIIVDNINTGTLLTASPVSHVFSDSVNVVYDEPIVTINYQMRIHYREAGTC